MNVCVLLEYRFSQTPDGAVWKETSYPDELLQRHLAVFDTVRVIARVQQVPEPPPRSQRADVDGIEFVPMPYYRGPWQYLRNLPAVRRAVRRAIGPTDAVILRVPCQLADVLHPILDRQCRPYGVQVVGDPRDVFAPGVVDHPLRPFFRWWFARKLRQQCRGACTASYVTTQTLQRRYPPAPGALSVCYSDVQVGSFLARSPRSIASKASWRLVTVGSLAQLYKGTDTLIDAVALCTREGLDLELVVVGDGRYRSQLQERAAAAGLADRVHFRGQLPAGEPVRAELTQADLFVLPSRTEGLPRALIEAMAHALPCLGSTVGGIPELLPPEDLFPANNPRALAHKIGEVLASPSRMEGMSQRNLARAGDFREDHQGSRRAEYGERLRAATMAWLERRSQGGQAAREDRRPSQEAGASPRAAHPTMASLPQQSVRVPIKTSSEPEKTVAPGQF